jgi:hypothetical protein
MTYSSFGCNVIYGYFPTYLFNIHNYNLSIGIFPRKSVYLLGEKYLLEQIFIIYILIAPTRTYLVAVSCLVKKVREIWHFQSAIKYEVAVIKCRKNDMEGRN